MTGGERMMFGSIALWVAVLLLDAPDNGLAFALKLVSAVVLFVFGTVTAVRGWRQEG